MTPSPPDGPVRRPASSGLTVLLGPPGRVRRGLLLRLAGERRAPRLVAPDDPSFPGLSVAANVAFPLRARGVDAGERRRIAGELLALAGLETEAARPARRLERTGHALLRLARGLAAADGHALCLDDPWQGLDAAGRETLAAVLRRIARLGRDTILLATDDRAAAFAAGDRFAVMEGDRIAQEGPLATLLAAPCSAAVAATIGHANLLVGRVEPDADDPDEAMVRLASDHRVPARLAAGVGPGTLCLVAVPPSRIAFAPVPAARMGEDTVAATLVEHRHLGTHHLLRLRLDDGTPVVVHRPLGTFTPRDAAAATAPQGASLAWRSGDAIAFPHPDA